MSNLLSLTEIADLLWQREATTEPLQLLRRLRILASKNIVQCAAQGGRKAQLFSVEQVRAMTLYVRLMEIGIPSPVAKQQMGDQIDRIGKKALPRQVGLSTLGHTAAVSFMLHGMEGY